MDESLPDENAISESSSLPFSVVNLGDFHSVFEISMARLRRLKFYPTVLDTNKISTISREFQYHKPLIQEMTFYWKIIGWLVAY
jgi:hypothetical protein